MQKGNFDKILNNWINKKQVRDWRYAAKTWLVKNKNYNPIIEGFRTPEEKAGFEKNNVSENEYIVLKSLVD